MGPPCPQRWPPPGLRNLALSPNLARGSLATDGLTPGCRNGVAKALRWEFAERRRWPQKARPSLGFISLWPVEFRFWAPDRPNHPLVPPWAPPRTPQAGCRVEVILRFLLSELITS